MSEINQELAGSNCFETDIKIIGEKSTNAQIVVLLSYIRHFLQTQTSGEITVNIGKNVNTNFFAFQVNNQEIPDILPKEEININ